MSKRFLFIAGNFSPESTGIGKYNGEMAEWLAAKGIYCTVVTTFPYYPQWKVAEPYKKRSYWYKKEVKTINGTPLTTIRCPHYVPKKPTAFKRFISDLTIFFSTSLVIVKYFFATRFDHVIVVSPPLLTGLTGLVYKKIKGAAFLYHIQDLQVDAARDLHMLRSKWLLKILFSVERMILQQADIISTVSEGMAEKVKKKNGKPVVLFPNWSDTGSFYPLPCRDEIKREYGFCPDCKIILYSGSIGEKQGLEILLTAAKDLLTIPHARFIICGEGPYRLQLELQAKSMGLTNIHFLPLQPIEKFNAFLNMADVHLIIQKKNAGDLVMPSKLTNILSVGGLAIVTCDAGTTLYKTLQENTIGIAIAPENPAMLSQSILQAINNNSKIRHTAREYAVTLLSKDTILSRYLSCISFKAGI